MLKTVLLVSGVSTDIKSIKKILENQYEIFETADCGKALEMLKQTVVEISVVLLDSSKLEPDGYEMLSKIRNDRQLSLLPVIILSDNISAYTEVLSLGAIDYITGPLNSELVRHRIRNAISAHENTAIINKTKIDELTGLFTRKAFYEEAKKMIESKEAGHYVLGCFDINSFKVINDQYGSQKGDEVLRYIAKLFKKTFDEANGICCHITADNFGVLYPRSFMNSKELEEVKRNVCVLDGSILPITFSVGRYVVDNLELSVAAMYDRASLAKASIKGRADIHIAMYDESMREKLLHEQEIISRMDIALKENRFEVWFQPQYNYSTGALIGAEALVRWKSKKNELIMPGEFIPVFERNGFIYELDKYVWEQCCKIIKKWIDMGVAPQPVSVNISRYDIFREDFVEVITGLVKKYEIPPELLRLEITESAFAKSSKLVISVVNQLIESGFTIEIDDFGSGYSSLNTLKDVPADVIKLDLKFLEENENSNKGGNILESIVRMANWIDMSVIAEGVETKEQADYMESIGCSYMQGYYFAKPMPIAEYEQFAKNAGTPEKMVRLQTVETLDNNAFWDPKAMETLIFNSYVGGACIFEYNSGKTEILRANNKYAEILGNKNKISTGDALKISWTEYMSSESAKSFNLAIQIAIKTGDEVVREYEFFNLPNNPGATHLRTAIRVIASAKTRYLIYCTNENITEQKEAEKKAAESAERIQAILKNAGSGITAIIEHDNFEVDFLFANDKYYEILGYTKEQFEIEVKSPFNCVSKKDISRVVREIKTLCKPGETTSIEFRAIRRDGTEVWVRDTASIINFADINSPVRLSVWVDITERKLAEEEIRDTDEQLRFLNDTAHELLAETDSSYGIKRVLERILTHFNADRAFLFEFDYENNTASNTYEVHNGKKKNGAHDFDAIPFELCSFWFSSFADRNYISIKDISKEEHLPVEELKKFKKRHVKSLAAVPLKCNGKLIGFISVDNPKRREQISRLVAVGDYIAVMLTRRDLNAKIEREHMAILNLMNDTPGGFARIRIDEKICAIEYVNNGFCKLVDMNKNEVSNLYGENLLYGVHPDDEEAILEEMADINDNGRINIGLRLKNGKGGYVYVIAFGSLIVEKGGKKYVNTYFADLTEKNELEEQRRSLVENLPCGAGIYEIFEDKITAVYLNGRCRSFLRLKPGEFASETVFGAVHEADKAEMEKELFAAAKSNRIASCDIRVRAKSGEYILLRMTGNIENCTDGKKMLYVTYSRISTKDASLREMLPIAFETMLKSSSELCFVKDKNLEYICCSDVFAKMVGLSDSKEIAGKNDYDLFPKELADNYRKDDLHVIKTRTPLINRVEQFISDDSVANYSSTSKYLLFDSLGNTIGIYGTGRDITEDKEAYSRLKLLTDSIQGGLATYICTKDEVQIVYYNDWYCNILGYTREEYGRIANVNPVSMVFEEDRRLIYKQLNLLIVKNEPIDCTVRARCVDGKYKWLNLKGKISERYGDKVIVNAVSYDVTKEIKAEEKLRMNAEEINIAMSQMGKMVLIYDVEEEKLTLPERYAKKHGLPYVIEGLNKKIPDLTIMSNNSHVKLKKFFDAILRGEKSGSMLIHIKCSDGSFAWERSDFIVIFDNNKNPVRAIISVEDVTEQHIKDKADKEVKDSEQILRLAAQLSNRIIYRYDIESREAYGYMDSDIEKSGIKMGADLPESLIVNGTIFAESSSELRQLFAEIHNGKPEGEAKIHALNAKGDNCWFDIRYSLIKDGANPKSAVLSLLDITDDHEKELAYDLYNQKIAANASDSDGIFAYLEADLTNNVTEKCGGTIMPDNIPEVGTNREETVRYIVRNYVEKVDRERCKLFFSREHLLTQFSDGARNFTADWRVTLPEGKKGYVRTEMQMIQDPYTEHIKSYTLISDITEEKLATIEVMKQAETDGMTGLYNKTKVESMIRDCLDEGIEGEHCILLIADLDYLKSINDTNGHDYGDRAIRLMAESLRSQFRRTDIVGRIGGDEFIVFFNNTNDLARLRSMVGAFMRKLSEVHIGSNKEIVLKASVGIAEGIIGQDTYEELFKKADTALYHVKRNGKDNYAIYTPEMEKSTYEYSNGTDALLWKINFFEKEELDRLLKAVSEIYPLVISVNLTQNSYYMMQYNHFTTSTCLDVGVFDDLIEEGAKTFFGNDKTTFKQAFARSNLLDAFNRGEKVVEHEGKQLGDDGVYRTIHTDVIFVKTKNSDDVMEITLSREVQS